MVGPYHDGSPLDAVAGQAPSHTVLVCGGAGYIGQAIVRDCLDKGWKVGYTYFQEPPSTISHPELKAFVVDWERGKGLLECFDALGPLARVVNAASLDDVAACEANPAAAAAVNVPSKLLDALDRHIQVHGYEPFLVHLSTDQLYDGTRQLAPEWCAGGTPASVYAKTKLAGEREVAARWPRHAIIRHSSIVYGPPPASPLADSQALWLQQVEADLRAEKSVTLPNDQYLTPTYLEDLVRVVRKAFGRQDALPNRVMNVGSPDRLSLYDLAVAVAQVRGYDASLVTPASSPGGGRDLSMSSARVERDFLIQLTPVKVALIQIFK